LILKAFLRYVKDNPNRQRFRKVVSIGLSGRVFCFFDRAVILRVTSGSLALGQSYAGSLTRVSLLARPLPPIF
jgi:hypothetical protein